MKLHLVGSKGSQLLQAVLVQWLTLNPAFGERKVRRGLQLKLWQFWRID